MTEHAHSRQMTLLIDMYFSPQTASGAVRLLVSGVQRTEAKPGCAECLVAQDAAEEGHVRYSEAWASRSALQNHLQSDEFRRVLAAMDMCEKEPCVTVGDVSGKKGIAYLQQLRDGVVGETDGQ